MHQKTNVAVLFGGCSPEYRVSLQSAHAVITHMDLQTYRPVLVGISPAGEWLHFTGKVEQIAADTWHTPEDCTPAFVSPSRGECALLVQEGGAVKKIHLDAAFPVLHGKNGEDGTVQGLLELARIPYVGCGVLSSAVSMDKLTTKILADTLGIRQARYVPVRARELAEPEAVLRRVEEALDYPVFVKPSNAGSSRGVSKAANRQELETALQVAAKEDAKILVEETIVGRELECAVLAGEEIQVSGVGEILAAAEFYDYDAKYNSEESRTVVDPELPEGKAEEIRRDAAAIFQAVDGMGLARVDFFLENGTNQVVFNEINTLPGFTSISMYPMLWAARGIPAPELVERLIQTAYLRR